MWKARLPTTSEHSRSPLRRRVAGEAGRRRSERWEGPRESISGIRGCGVPSRFGRSLGSGICPGLRECGRFPLAPRCPRLASRGPHPAPSLAVHFVPRGRAAPNLGGGSIPGIGMESAQFPSSSQGLKFVLSAVEGQPSDALSVSGVITNVGQLTAARRLTNISGSACLFASRST